jgi:hypothetical protein
MTEAMQQIIEAVKQASPFLWHAAYHFVIVDSVMGILFGLFLGGMAVFMFHLTKKYEESDGVVLAWTGCVVSIIVSIFMIFMNTEQLLTLDYSAVEALTKLAIK